MPSAGGFGLHATDQTSPVSVVVETAARAPMSHTLIVLSADLMGINNGYQRLSEPSLTLREPIGHLAKYPHSEPTMNGL